MTVGDMWVNCGWGVWLPKRRRGILGATNNGAGLQRQVQEQIEEKIMDALTHRQIAVVASRNQGFQRIAEQERLAAQAIATSPRPRGSSDGIVPVASLAVMEELVARIRCNCRPRAVVLRGLQGRNLAG